MNLMTTSEWISCPYCGEEFELLVDGSVEEQEYIEDCYVCCRPILLTIVMNEVGEVVSVLARHENEC
jgi:hypothetical protein